METITRNQSPKVREATLYGRKYLVAPLTLIVPGVLNGSQGPLFYSEDEIGKNPDAWNGVPIVVRHPQDSNGKHRSGRDPEVINAQGIGYVFKARSNGKLRAEGWFDVDRTNQIDARVLTNLRLGKPVELSTGLFTDNEPAENGASYKGKGYTHVARNYRPDHLAVLPDQEGACSVKDGCGVNVNANPEGCNQYKSCGTGGSGALDKLKPGTVFVIRDKGGLPSQPYKALGGNRFEKLGEMRDDRSKIMGGETLSIMLKEFGGAIQVEDWNMQPTRKNNDRIITNIQNRRNDMKRLKPERKQEIIENLLSCNDCGWQEDDRETLNAFPDAKLMTMDECRKAMAVKNEKLEEMEPLINAVREITGEKSLTVNEMPAALKKALAKKKGDEDDEDEDEDSGKKGKKKVENEKKPLTNEELLQAMTPEMKEDLAFARNEKARQKGEMIDRLTANVADDQKASLVKRLQAKPLDELHDLLALVPETEQVQPVTQNYSGQAAGVPVTNKAKLTYVGLPGEMVAGRKETAGQKA